MQLSESTCLIQHWQQLCFAPDPSPELANQANRTFGLCTKCEGKEAPMHQMDYKAARCDTPVRYTLSPVMEL